MNPSADRTDQADQTERREPDGTPASDEPVEISISYEDAW